MSTAQLIYAAMQLDQKGLLQLTTARSCYLDIRTQIVLIASCRIISEGTKLATLVKSEALPAGKH